MYNYNKEFEEIVISKDFETKTYASSEDISAMIDRMKEEDEIAFEDFVANFAGFVFWYVKSRINADDDMIRQLVLDTFQRAYFKIKGFHYNDKKQLMSWLVCVSKTVIYHHFRKKKNEVTVVYDDEFIESYNENYQIDDIRHHTKYYADDIKRMYKCLDEKEIFVAEEHVVKKRSFSDIAEELHVSTSKVSNIYYRALKKCQREKADN